MDKKRRGRMSLKEQVNINISTLELMAGHHLPELRERYIQKKRKTKTGGQKTIASESSIQKTIMKSLAINPNVAWFARFNSGVFQDGDRYIRAHTQPGMSDIMGMLHGGKLFAIEVKSEKGKPSEDQAAFLEKIARGGGLSGVARSIDDVTKIIGG